MSSKVKKMTTSKPYGRPAGINPDAKFLTAEELSIHVKTAPPKDRLYQIYAFTARGVFLVYLDTTTQHLVYNPLVSGASDAAANYSTIFTIHQAPTDKQPPGAQLAYVFRNYVTSGLAPKLTQIARSEYRLRMEAPFPGGSELSDYKVFYIENLSQRSIDPRSATRKILTISVPGEDIYWCPINEMSTSAGERLVYAKNTMGQFQIAPVPTSFNISLPFPLVSLKAAVVKGKTADS